MANTRELRRRIKSIKNTGQITKAMQMVAATKMRRAQSQALNSRPYNNTLARSLSLLLPKVHPEAHPLLYPNKAEKVAVLVLSTDKSLCGSLNTNLFREIQNFVSLHQQVVFYSLGKKATRFLVKTEKDLEANFENLETVTFLQAAQIAKLFVKSFLSEEIKEAYVIYPRFISTLSQEPVIVKILPIEGLVSENQEQSDQYIPEFLLEPNADELLEYILFHSIETKIYQALLETKASEHSARMMAMQNATENAKELVQDLQLTYNQTRQDSITRELLEITSALAAFE